MGTPGHEIMTPEEMDEMNLVTLDNRLYSKDADGNQQISAILTAVTEKVVDRPKKIRLNDLPTVEAVTKDYIKSCLKTGVIPSKQGHARAMGVTRQCVTQYMSRNDNPTTEYLSAVYDSFAEALQMASMTGRVHPIVSIFVLKSIYGYVEHEPEILPSGGLIHEDISEDELRERIMNTVILDEE